MWNCVVKFCEETILFENVPWLIAPRVEKHFLFWCYGGRVEKLKESNTVWFEKKQIKKKN